MVKNEPRHQTVLLDKTRNFEITHLHDSYEKKAVMHHHDYLEIYYFVDGNISYQIEGTQYNVSPNSIMVIDDGDLHKPIIKSKNCEYERYILKITKEKLINLSTPETNLSQLFDLQITDKKLKLFTLNTSEAKIITALFDSICCNNTDASEPLFGEKELVDCYIKQLFIFLNRYFMNAIRVITLPDTENPIAINDILDYIANNLHTELSGDQLSKEFYISKFYLSREFKRYVGTTMHRYIVQKKLILAKELILEGIPINEIYDKCGFADYCNFFRAFKSEYGLTPKNFYRESIKKVQ